MHGVGVRVSGQADQLSCFQGVGVCILGQGDVRTGNGKLIGLFRFGVGRACVCDAERACFNSAAHIPCAACGGDGIAVFARFSRSTVQCFTILLVGHGDLAVVLITGVLNGYFLGAAVIGQVSGLCHGKVCGVQCSLLDGKRVILRGHITARAGGGSCNSNGKGVSARLNGSAVQCYTILLIGHGNIAVFLGGAVLHVHIHPLGVAVIGQVGGQDKGKVCAVCRRQLCHALAGGAQVEDMGLRDVILTQVDGAGVALCIIAHRAAISYAVHALDGRVGDDRDGVQIGVNVEGGDLCAPDALDHAVDAVDVFFSVLGIFRCSVVQGVVIRSAVQVLGFLCHQRVDDGVILNDAALIIDNGALAAVNDGLVGLCVAVIAGRIFHRQLQGVLAVFDRAAVFDHGSAGVTGAVIAAVQHSLIGSHVDYRISGNIQRRVADGSGLRRVAPAVADVVKAQHRILHKAVIVKALRAVQLGIRDDAALPIVHIPGGVQRTAEGAVVFDCKFYCTGLICHLVEVQHSVLLDGQGGDIVCKQFCVLVVRFKGPAVALGTIDAAVCTLGEAVCFNDQFFQSDTVEPDSFRAHSKADCAVLGVIV